MSSCISLLLAGTLSLTGLVFPYLLARHATALNQSLLLVMMLGVMAGYYHGFGFRAGNRWLAAAVSPALAWPVMIFGAAGMLLAG